MGPRESWTRPYADDDYFTPSERAFAANGCRDLADVLRAERLERDAAEDMAREAWMDSITYHTGKRT